MPALAGLEKPGLSGLFTALFADSYVLNTEVQLRPMIYVFPSGRCCFVNTNTGQKDCREQDDNGNDVVTFAFRPVDRRTRAGEE